MSKNAQQQQWHRAINYPYAWPGSCFLFVNGQHETPKYREPYREGRTPVLAYGSNRAPEQLLRKFGSLHSDQGILVEACTIKNTDVIHSAHLTNYGAIPAAIQPVAGVDAKIAITWLTDDQLVIMDHSEKAGINYGRVLIDEQISRADGSTVDRVEGYQTSHGALHIDGTIVSQADVEASGRRGGAWKNIDVLKCAHRCLGTNHSFDEFVTKIITDDEFRIQLTEKLKHGLNT
jgi:hypothetical protein